MDAFDFLGGSGHGTSGEITCNRCGRVYNKGADDLPEDGSDPIYDEDDMVHYIEFADMVICEDCQSALANQIINRMPTYIANYKELMVGKITKIQKTLNMIKEIEDLKKL